ncbi:MAG: mucoidy inhibitor MuiA family protein [Leptospiraceae bacterium]|nr:mucoidy inhibitor MuiA family protein [Leptospiraceae bacterium]
MKTRCRLRSLLGPGVMAMLLTPAIQGNDQGVQTVTLPIDAVQLYADQALVTRGGAIALQPGLNRFQLTHLPVSLQADSIQVQLSSSKGLKIIELGLEKSYSTEINSKRAREADQLLQKAERELRILTDRYQALTAMERFLSQLTVAEVSETKKEAGLPLGLDAWQSTLDFQMRTLARNHEEQLQLQGQIDLAREQYAVALALVDRYQSEKQRESRALWFVIESDRKLTSQVAVQYRVQDASWYPVYTARVESSAGGGNAARVSLQSYALVKNQSGEDWSQVQLRFSAADLDESVDVLKLSSWQIRAHEREVAQNTNQSIAMEADNAAGVSDSSDRDEYAKTRSLKRKDAKVAEEVSRPSVTQSTSKVNPAPYQERQLRLKKAQEYYKENQLSVSSRGSRQRSDQSSQLLQSYQSNAVQLKQSLDKGRYQDSLRYSEELLDNLNNLPQDYQGYFEDVRTQVRQDRALALRMLENQKLIQKLVKPGQGRRDGGFDYRYTAPLRETIRTDASFHKIYLGKYQLQAELGYETAPARSLHCFLTGAIQYTRSVPLLAGPVSVFHNADYLGESKLDSIVPGSQFKLHLGSDDRILVSRQQQNFQSTSGLITTAYNKEFQIEVRLQNLNKAPVTVQVFERVPYSEDERVEITVAELDPPASESLERRGLYRFAVALEPGVQKKVRLRYTIKHDRGILPIPREVGGTGW